MPELPILFTGEMVRAILGGRKTQTRRAIPIDRYGIHFIAGRDDNPNDPRNWGVETVHGDWCLLADDPGDRSSYALPCPYGQPGDLLYVRETFCPVDDTSNGGRKWIDYRATPAYDESHPAGWDNAPDDPQALKWRPSIHMPKWAARLWLRVTDVRVERVQEITERDALSEGFPDNGSVICEFTEVARPWFRQLWDSLNAKRGFGWDVNPWVWIVSFEVASTTGRANVREVAA